MSQKQQPSPPDFTVQLIHIEGPLKGQIQEFEQTPVTIGRATDSSVVFPPVLKAISRHHAEIRREGNRFKLIDLSTNGTFVQGRQIDEVYLKDGDVITFSEDGPKASFLSVIKKKAEPAVSKAQPEAPKPVSFIPPPAGPPSGPVTITIQLGTSLKTYRQSTVYVGSDPGCDVVIDLPGVAPKHLEICHSQLQFWLKDLTGESRSLLNGMPLTQATVLRADDLLQLNQAGPAFTYAGDGKFFQREGVVPPYSQEPLAVSNNWETPSSPKIETDRSGTGPVVTPSLPGARIPVWVWVAAGSAALVMLIVYLISRWTGG